MPSRNSEIKLNPPVVATVLNGMRDYWIKNDRNFHISFKVGYCMNCEAIRGIGGDYRVSGFDCGGENFTRVEEEEKCLSDRSKKFIVISTYDMTELRKIYGERTPKLLIDAIKKSTGKGEFDFPDLYNPNLPEIMRRWNTLSTEEKERDIANLFRVQELFSKTEKMKESLESALSR